MKITLCVLAVILAACIAPQPQMAPIQIMPYQADDPGARAGCIRTLARLVVESQSYVLWPMDRIYAYCDEIERSYYDELRMKDLRST